MVLPNRIFKAARDGDRDTVIAYLNAPAEAGGLPDVNEQSFTGGTILMAAVCQIDSAARLAFVWELVSRGASGPSGKPYHNILFCTFCIAARRGPVARRRRRNL